MNKAIRITLILIIIIALAIAAVFIRDAVLYRIDLSRYPIAYTDLISEYSSEFALDPFLVISLMRIESSFDPKAVSSVGARGLMQIMPDTGAWIAHKLGEDSTYTDDILFDPESNIRFACWYIRFLKQRFNGYEKAIVCAYNAGHGTLERWLANESYTMNGSLNLIPNADVKQYFERYTAANAKYHELYPDLFH